MGWRDEIITSRTEAESFLRHELAVAAQTTVNTQSHEHPALWTMSAFGTLERGERELMNIDVFSVDAVRLTNLWVTPDLQGKGLGAKSVKATLGIAYEEGADRLDIINVTAAGASFWPRMGALPYDMQQPLSVAIENVLKRPQSRFGDEDTRMVLDIAKMAKTKPYKAWRALSQTDIKCLDGSLFSAAVYRGWKKQAMYIPLNDAPTLAVLESHVGALPAFKPHRPALNVGAAQLAKLEA